MKKIHPLPFVLVGAGLGTVAAAFLAVRKSRETVEVLHDAISAPPIALPPAPAVLAALPKFKARTTGYWPFTATESERKMEGGTNDRKGKPLYTLEQHLAGKAPYVSVSGDDAVFPYGQRLTLDVWPGAVFRVVDTGGHFRGAGKVYRIAGYEPLDICVDSDKTVMPKTAVAQIVPGDNFDKGKAVATSGIRDQTVAGLMEGRTSEDHEALARALESELGHGSREEQVSAAWAMRNRADVLGVSLATMLVPSGVYGSPQVSGGYASTRRPSTERSREVAEEVLGSDTDPTDGAVDYWMPAQQKSMRLFGDIYRAALKSGDIAKARRYARYADYGTEEEVRARHEREGLSPTRIVGTIELLGRV